jgi:DNA-binding CsgD family transcriptional regulator
VVDVIAELERGRKAYATQSWSEAYAALSSAERSQQLAAEDLELLATSAYMLGRESEYLRLLERAHRSHLDAGEPLAALRCAFWVGVNLARQGEMGRAGGWLARAQRLLEREEGERVERGYLLLPAVFEQTARHELERAAAIAGEAAAIGEQFGDADLFALAAHEQGHILIQDGRLTEGLRLLDEAMVAVTTGELSPIVSGIVYCGVILACQTAHELRRAQEWTAALTEWCERQPDIVAFSGRCLVHRAEIMQLRGEWEEALAEARRAAQRCLQGENPAGVGEAAYREGEINRLLGNLAAAEDAYREASRRGREPQPGLALLRLAQGNSAAAEAAIQRVLAETAEAGGRAQLLPAQVEIALAAGDVEAAARASGELELLAKQRKSDALGAMAAQTRGAVELARGAPADALPALRGAERAWQQLEVPYEVARTRWLLGLVCRALGDEDAAELELEAARETLTGLGAASDLARLESLGAQDARAEAFGLTGRELEVLQHLAAGETNKAIASALVVSERTVDRHVSNIFAKLGVSTRAAATACAYEHRLLYGGRK